ncbi:hypothetical protein BC829DRAFT_164721 [Chytridium lagenaria]|nr:hypothetical protein BC829DRAFT_164721 [Chytridium lagenaria]
MMVKMPVHTDFDQHLLHGNTTGREMESIDVDSMAGLLGISYSESLEAMSESFSQDMNSNMGSPSRRTSGSDEVNSFKEMEMDECMMFKQENADPTDVEMGACKIYTEESDGTQQALQNAVGKTDYKIDTSDLNLHGVDESHIFSAPTHSPSLSFKLEDLAYHRHGLDLDNGNSSTASPRIAALSPSSRLSLSLAALYTSPATAAAVTSSTTSAAKRWRRFSHSGEIVMRQAVAMASSFATHQPDTYTAMPSIGTSSAIDFGPLSTDEGPRLEGSSQFRQSKPMNETADFIGDSFETLEQEIKGKGMDFTCQYPPSLDSGKISQTFNEAECFSHGTSNLGLMSPSTNFRSTDEIPSTPWVHSHSVSSPAILPAAAASPFFSTAKTVAGAGNALPMRAKRRFSSTYTGEPYRQVLPGSGIQTATQSSKNHARTLSGSLHSIWSQDATDENHAPIGEVARAMLSRWSTAGGGSSSGTSSVSSIAGGREYPLRRSRFSSLVTPTSSISSGATPPIFDSPSSSFFADERTRSSSASSWVTASPASSFTETLSGLSLLSPSTNPSPGAAGIFAALGSTRNEMALSVAPPLNYLNHLLSPDISPIHGIGGDMEILHTYPNGSDVIFDFPNVESSDTSHTASSGKPFGISPHSKSWQLDQRPTHSTVGSESSELPCDGIEFHSNQMDEIALSSRLAAEHMTHNTNTYDASSQQGFLSHPFHGHPSPWYGAQISPAIQSCFIPNGEAGYNVGLDQHSNRVLPNAEIVGSPDGIVGD